MYILKFMDEMVIICRFRMSLILKLWVWKCWINHSRVICFINCDITLHIYLWNFSSQRAARPPHFQCHTLESPFVNSTSCLLGPDNIVPERLSLTLHSCEANRGSFFWTLLDLSADRGRAIRSIIHSFH